MSGIKALLTQPEILTGRLRMKSPDARMLHRAVEALSANGAQKRDLEQTAALQERLASIANEDKMATLSRRDLREGGKVFFNPPMPPGRSENVSGRLLDEILARHHRAGFLALIETYLDSFDRQDPDILRLAKRLEIATAHWPWREADVWPRCAEKWRLFEPAAAPSLIAEAILDSDLDPCTILESAGLHTEQRQRGGLAEAAFQDVCLIVAKAQGRDVVRLQNNLLSWAATPEGSLAFPKSWPVLVDALLLPWRNAQPGEQHKLRLLQSLDRFGGGDPRMRPARWGIIKDRASESYAILLRWLTRASVMQFLDIVDQTAEPQMWRYRRAFWTFYLQQGRIDAAWVAFGKNGALLARQAARDSSERSLAAFGVQRGKSSDHAALLLQIGDLLIVDWSHNGKYNVWRKGQGNRPGLFEAEYSGFELDCAPLRDSHGGAANYTWQKRLAEIIEERGFYIERPEWRPRRV